MFCNRLNGKCQYKILSTIIFSLGIVCLFWIIFDIVNVYSNLSSVIFFGTLGLIVGVGYIFILIFHILVLFVYFKYFHNRPNNKLSIGFLSFIIISFLALVVQKAMYDEVGREYYLEFPAPGEVRFIYLGLIINALFILYALYRIRVAPKTKTSLMKKEMN